MALKQAQLFRACFVSPRQDNYFLHYTTEIMFNDLRCRFSPAPHHHACARRGSEVRLEEYASFIRGPSETHTAQDMPGTAADASPLAEEGRIIGVPARLCRQFRFFGESSSQALASLE